jgi:hypothetical protein
MILNYYLFSQIEPGNFVFDPSEARILFHLRLLRVRRLLEYILKSSTEFKVEQFIIS